LVTTWRFFLHKAGIETPRWLLSTSAVLGLLSFALSLSSHFLFRFQGRWLHSRFITERLRQWNFHQLLDGSFVALSQTDADKFDKELRGRWAKAKFEVFERAGTVDDFLNSEQFELFVEPSVCPDQHLGAQVLEAYRYLRLDYQVKYFSFKKDLLRTLDIWTNGLAKLALLAAGFLALGEVIILLIQRSDDESNLGWILGASALSAALISAAIRVVRSARAISEDTERYTSKWVRLKILAERFRRETAPNKQLECMVETERVCIEELREFMRTFSKSDYLL
jgi:hypothetical protein